MSSVKAMGEETSPGSPLTEATPPAPEDAYGFTKLEAEREVRSFCDANGIAWTIVRPPLIFA
jgi:UDP-glucose 4-epimerase